MTLFEWHPEETFRLLVTGSRYATDLYEVIGYLGYELQHQRSRGMTITIVHGDCPTGVDALTKQWITEQQPANITQEPWPAEGFGPWPACGPKRNRHMVSLGADLCVGLTTPGCKGTWGCLQEASNAGIMTRSYGLKSYDLEQYNRFRAQRASL